MSLKLRLLCRVIKRRMAEGETLKKVLEDYPKLTDAERKVVKEECGAK